MRAPAYMFCAQRYKYYAKRKGDKSTFFCRNCFVVRYFLYIFASVLQRKQDTFIINK